jgi:hypothetical protein
VDLPTVVFFLLAAVVCLNKNTYLEELFKIVIFVSVLGGMLMLLNLIGL